MMLDIKTKGRPTLGINLTEKALHILKKMYLKRDEQEK